MSFLGPRLKPGVTVINKTIVQYKPELRVVCGIIQGSQTVTPESAASAEGSRGMMS